MIAPVQSSSWEAGFVRDPWSGNVSGVQGSSYAVVVVVVVKPLSNVELLCDTMYCSPLGSSVQGIPQARIMQWVAISFSRGSSWPRDWICISYIVGRFYTSEQPGKPTPVIWETLNRQIHRDKMYSSVCMDAEFQSGMVKNLEVDHSGGSTTTWMY